MRLEVSQNQCIYMCVRCLLKDVGKGSRIEYLCSHGRQPRGSHVIVLCPESIPDCIDVSRCLLRSRAPLLSPLSLLKTSEVKRAIVFFDYFLCDISPRINHAVPFYYLKNKSFSPSERWENPDSPHCKAPCSP